MSTSEEAVLRLDFERNLPVLQHWGLQLSREQEQSVKDYLTRFYDDSLWQKPGTVEIDLRSVPQVCGRWSLTVTPQAADGRFRVLELRRPADEMRRNQARGVVLGGDRGAGGELSGVRMSDRWSSSCPQWRLQPCRSQPAGLTLTCWRVRD